MKLDVIKLAQEAGFTMKPPEWVPAQTQQLEHFAALILDECKKACRPDFIAEYPPGSGKDDWFDLGRMHCVEVIEKLKEFDK